MGYVVAALLWLTALSVTALAAFLAAGDRALSLAARRFASAYVGDKFEVRWSVADGAFEVRGLALGRALLTIIEPMLGLPMDLEFVRLERFRLELPWLVLLSKLKNKADGDKPLQSTVEIAGLQIGLSVNEPEKWLAMREENLERFQQAVKDAAAARIAKANYWTAQVVQKLKDLAAARATVKQQKEEKMKSKAAPGAAPPTPTPPPPAWQQYVDVVLDSFAIVVPGLAVTIRDDYSASGIGIALEHFEIGRANAVSCAAAAATRRQRVIRVSEFALFLNPVAHTDKPSFMIRPVTMEVRVTMPYIMQSLIMGAIPEKRSLDLAISFQSDVTVQLRPMQLTKLLNLVRPLSFHADWFQRALALDESSCVEIMGAEVEEYMELYTAQYKLDNETGLVSRLIANYRQKEEVTARKARLEALEAKALATRLLYLRSVALDWAIPSGGVVLPHKSGVMKRRKDLRTFIASPLTKYVTEYVPPPMFHSIGMSMSLHFCELQLLENTDIELLSLFACDMCLGLRYALEIVPVDDTALDLDFKIQRFGILDERNVPSNVFRRLLDQSPGARHLMAVRILQTGGGHIDLDFALEDLTLLVIFDPLLHATKLLMAALNEDEATEMRYLAYSALNTPQSPEQREEAQPVYRSEVPQEYSPLFLGGMSLRSQFVMNGCEICLLGDSTTLKTHVLAFTTDMTLKVVSSARHEAIEMELVDVALVPCRIVILDDAIDLEIRAGMRTILEIEGEGVDLLLGYKMVVGDGRPPASATSTASEKAPKKSGATLWGAARTAMASKQIAEVEHEELKRTEEESVHSSGSASRIKAAAHRKLVLRISDFAMNMSANDLGVLLSIVAALNESMKEDADVIRHRENREKRMAKARKDLEEQRLMERLKTEFERRDVDGGGTLDAEEIGSLIESVANCQNLTKEEFDATVREFLLIVDRDGSGDVSLEEFEDILGRKKTVYHRVHRGVVSLTGREYDDPARPRSSVPALAKGHNSSMADMAKLAQFWERYEQQVGASKSSLNGIPAKTVQKKMVRAFKNYEYAQEAWNRLVNPSLAKPGERSAWLLTKAMDMGSRGNVIDQLLSSFDSEKDEVSALAASAQNQHLHMFIQTIISTSFGGFYIRLIDENLANRVPSIELSAEEVAFYANFAVWEGETPTSDAELAVVKRAHNNDYGIAKLSFAVYGKYYNPTARQVEPFMEYFPGTLDIRKDPETHLDIVFTSDRYFQLNVTSAFMEVVKNNLATFTKVEAHAQRERAHIKEEGGIFWMLNETGVNLTYYVVAKKQTKDRVRAETVTAVSSVPANEPHACILLSEDEELKESEQQSLKEKQLRVAFRNADSDNSGELDVNEVRSVLLEVYEEEMRNRRHDRRGTYVRDSSGASSAVTRSESMFSNDAELDKIVDDFVVLADTDGSGQVSFEEFKIAIAKMRETVDRFITLEVEGYEPIHNIPISSIGHTQVYELIPFFEEVETEKSIAYLYQEAVALLNSEEEPTYQELQKAFACLRRVREMDPHYEWIDSYYSQCAKKYLPVMVAVHVSVDGVFGLQVKVTSAEYIRNDTAKTTECLLVDERHEVSLHNPLQSTLNENGEKQRFFVLPPKGSIPIPLDLVGVGSFAIRQIGEVEWSNFLPLTAKEQRVFKNLTAFEKRQAKDALHGDKSRLSLSSSKMVSEKMGHSDPLPDLNEYVPPGKEVTYPSTSMIDNQPTQVIEMISINDHQLGTWSIVILPQLELHNVLPCGLEYAIVQTHDCPVDMLDSSGEFRLGCEESGKSKTKSVSTLGKIDYFQYVNEVNGRRLYVESGKSVQVFGLDLEKPALMKVRLCASESNRGGNWSHAFMVKLNATRKVFDSEKVELRFGDDENSGPVAIVEQQWQQQSARSLSIFAPYWIQNRSGLDFRFRLSKGGVMCPIEAHRTYFNGAKDVPLLANAPDSKAMVSVRPFQETATAYESDFLLSRETKKYLPNFERVDWSNQVDMSSVGYKGEFGANDHSFVVAYEVLAAPGHFYRSKIFRISPRVIIVNRVPRPLQVTPMMLDKKMRSSSLGNDAKSANVGLGQGEALVAYRFAGKEKHHTGLRLRDVYRDEALKEIGEWSPTVPIKAGEDYNVWTRGSLGDGPVCNIAFQNVEETIIAAIEDSSKTPRYRIENRSTRHAFRYVQNGVKNAEEIVIKPLESHSFVWEDPLMEDRKLRVTPFSWKIPTLIDVRNIGPRSMLTSDGMYSEVYIDGSTRVFAVGDTPTYEADRAGAELNDWLSNTRIDVGIHGFGLTIVDRLPQEVMNMTFENMRVTSSVHSRRIVFSLHHMQIDDMSPQSMYPVVLAPLDTGFNSDKREDWLPKEGERPFFSLALDTIPKQTEITIVNDFELDVNSMKMNLNLEYILGLVNLLMEFIPTSDEDAIIQQTVDYKNQLLTLQLNVPEHTTLGGMLLYFKKWCMTPFEFHLVFDSSTEDRGEGISAILGTTIGSIVGGIAHVTPEFDFHEIRYENRFFYEYDLMYTVVLDIVYAVIGQWYKIVGSVELLGDPVGLAADIVDGLALAARQFKRDVKGKSVRKGESALTIVQTVVGAPMRSIGKVSNGLGDVVKKATRFESQEVPDQPRHVPEGVVQSGVVFGKSIAYGVKGFVKEPVRGAKKDGLKGFAKGVGRGTMQLVASPFVGTLGVVEKMSVSVSNTTHLLDDKAFDGTRRPARDLGASPLKPLSESNVITEVELHVLYAEGLPDKANPQVVVRVYQQAPGGPAHDIAKYKSSTFHHTGAPKFDQSWLIPVASHDTFIEVHLLHKRKPVPKKPLGHVRLSMEDIYRDFDGVPAKILADTKAKMRLRRRKRVTGSILNEIAESSSSAIEVRDESWRQRMSRPSMANFMSDEAEVEVDENDDYENDANLLSSRSLVTDQPLEIHPRGLPLEGAENPNAKIFVSIRYVNDMRRYA